MGSLPEELMLDLFKVIRALCTTNGTWNGDMSQREAQSVLAKCAAHQENEIARRDENVPVQNDDVDALAKVVAE